MKRKIEFIAIDPTQKNVEQKKTEKRRVIENGSTFLVILDKKEFPFAKSKKWLRRKLGYEEL